MQKETKREALHLIYYIDARTSQLTANCNSRVSVLS
jgi:hypothetical protein